jgi:hypothetical protein
MASLHLAPIRRESGAKHCDGIKSMAVASNEAGNATPRAKSRRFGARGRNGGFMEI